MPPSKTLLSAVCLSLLLGVVPLVQAAPPTLPKPLATQIERLVGLLKDRYASGYPDATLTQKVRVGAGQGQEWMLVVFTIEGFGGGNSHAQYLAVFEVDSEDKNNPYYSLLDFRHVGGKGWRAINQLGARVSSPAKSGIVNIDLDAQVVADGDAPNFPSKKATVRLVMKDGKLLEK